MQALQPVITPKREHLRKPLFNAVLVFVAFAAAVNAFASLFFLTTSGTKGLALSVVTILMLVIVYGVAQRKSIYGASILLTLTMWGEVSWLVMMGGGIYGPNFSGYIIILVIAVTLLGTRWGVTFALMSALVGGVTTYLAYSGLLSYAPIEPSLVWATYLVFFIIAIGVVGLAYHYIQLALKQAWAHEQSLTETNHQLTMNSEALHRANRAYRLLSSCNQAVTRATSEADLLKSVCSILTAIGEYEVAAIATRTQPGAPLHLVAHAERSDQPEVDARFTPGSSLSVHAEQALIRRQPVIVEEKGTLCYGLFPLVIDGIAECVLFVQATGDHLLGQDEVTLLSELTDDTIYGITAQRVTNARREESARLQANNDLLTATLSSIDQAVFVLEGTERTIRTCNAAAEQISGYASEELIGKPISILHANSDSYNQFVQRRAEHLANHQSYQTPLLIRHRSGELRHVDVTIAPLCKSDSLRAGEVSILRDVTEDHLKNERLSESEANYRNLFNSMQEGFVVHRMIYDDTGTAVDYEYIEVNPAFERLTQLKREDVVGKTARMVLPRIAPEVIAGYDRVVKCGEVLHKEELVPDMNRYFSITAFRPSPGQFVSTFHDITDKVKAQEALEDERALLSQRVEERTAALTQANLELAQTAQHKDEFLASMSHELRTPLNAILGIAEAMNEEVYGALNETQKAKLRNIEVSGRHLLDLINDVLDMAKIEAGKLTLEIDRVDVKATCETSLQLIRQVALKKRLQINLQIDPKVTFIQADGRRLKQMLINLLSNAAKFTPQEGMIGLEVTQDEYEGSIYFVVWDTGIGIAPEHQKRLFQPFVQVDSSLSRQYEGSGLGLALVHKMAQLHGGTISLESTLGSGSKFIIKLPLPSREVTTAPNLARSAALPARPWRSALVLEDAISAAEQMTRYLHELGIDVVHHQRATGALARVQQVNPDIIFLDILLPDGDGWDILAQLKQTDSTASIPVVITSVVDRSDYAWQLGAAGCLLKPFERGELHNILNHIAVEIGDDPSPDAAEAQTPSVRILLVEDNELTAETFAEYLADKGYAVSVAHNGEEAVNATQISAFDLILMDVQMPHMDGLEATRRIRAGGICRETPILALTALSMPGDEERCLQAGATAYLSKPVRLQQLIAYIEKLTQAKLNAKVVLPTPIKRG